jgi:hypothetical protein
MRTAKMTAAIVAASLALAALLTLRALRDPGAPTDEDRAIAMGLLIDTPAEEAVIDDGLRVAEALRRRYGIASGNAHADRVAAAIRARDELLATVEPTPEQLRVAAEALGFSLDPARCGNACGNVARLARLELQKEALRRFASDGAAWAS